MSRSTTGCLAAGSIPNKKELIRANRWERQAGKTAGIKHDKTAYNNSLRRAILADLKDFPGRRES